MYYKKELTEKCQNCKHCGISFVYESVGLRKKVYCSPECAVEFNRIQWRDDPEKVAKRNEWQRARYAGTKRPQASCVCVVCSKSFLAKTSQPAVCCSPNCYRKKRYHADIEKSRARCRQESAIRRKKPIVSAECLMCGASYSCTEKRASHRTFCNRQCKVEFSRHVRRAKHSGQYIKFKSVEIFEKYGWTCHLCSKPILKSFEYPDPQSPSLDHIIPLSKGGWHAPWNCRPAHLGCNSRKGDKLPPVLSHKQYHIVT